MPSHDEDAAENWEDEGGALDTTREEKDGGARPASGRDGRTGRSSPEDAPAKDADPAAGNRSRRS